MTTKYAVVGQGWIADGTLGKTNSTRRLVPGVNNINITVAGDLLITMCSGTSASAASDVATVTGSPVSCPQAAATSITVVGTGNINITVTYNSTANTNSIYSWSLASGGVAGAAVPGSGDAVLCDSNSFTATGQTLTVNANFSCLSWDWTGTTNTPALAISNGIALSVYGDVTFIAGMSTSAGDSGSELKFANTSGTVTLRTNTLSLTFSVDRNGAGGTTQLGDDLNSTAVYGLQVNRGIFNCNGHSVTCSGAVYILGSNTRTFNMSGVTVTCGTWTATTTTGLTFTTDASSKIVVTNATTFNGGSLTNYKEVDLNGAGTTTIAGSNTFVSLVLPSATTQTIQFTDGTTQHITTPTLSGSAGHVHTLTGTSTGGWNIVKDGGGTIFADWVTITYSAASPATTWYYGSNSTYTSTSGWALCALPTITLSAANPVGSTTATLNGNITSVNGSTINPTVSMYYGTSDGLQVPANWANTVSPTSPSQPQGVAAFYYNATGLSSHTKYFFSASATNLAGTVWVTKSLYFPVPKGGIVKKLIAAGIIR